MFERKKKKRRRTICTASGRGELSKALLRLGKAVPALHYMTRGDVSAFNEAR